MHDLERRYHEDVKSVNIYIYIEKEKERQRERERETERENDDFKVRSDELLKWEG